MPDTAERVRTMFADQLDSSTGRIAQLYVAARLSRRIETGDFPELAEPLSTYVRRLES